MDAMQLDLFGNQAAPPPPTVRVHQTEKVYERKRPERRLSPPATPLALARRYTRKNSPDSSLQALEERIAAGHWDTAKTLALVLVRRHPGRTIGELAELGGTTRYHIAPALTHLKDIGAVYYGEKTRRCTVAHTPQREWFPVEKDA